MFRITVISFFAFLSVAFLTGCSSNASGTEITLREASDAETHSDDKGAGAPEDTVSESDLSRDREEEVFIYVCGAVKSPGVYTFAEGTRIYEAINAAGGFGAEADSGALNLAEVIRDGQKLYVPTVEETSAGQTSYTGEGQPAETSGGASGAGLVNINTAGLSELTTINGIGESRARDIISYREQSGGFSTIEDIMKVPGIKDGLFSKIKDRITV